MVFFVTVTVVKQKEKQVFYIWDSYYPF